VRNRTGDHSWTGDYRRNGAPYRLWPWFGALGLALLLLAGCGAAPTLRTPTAPATPTITATPTLKVLQTAINLGTAVNYDALVNDAEYRALIQRYFTTTVPENEMKFDAIEPQQGTFDFAKADAIVRFAQENHIAVRGHVLVANGQLPDWLKNGSFTRDQAMAILKNHIETVVGHYRGQVISWDVINEAFLDGPWALRNNFWMRAIGPDYISLAFIWAHEADPQAVLYYNDYSAEEMNGKSSAIYALLKNLRAQNIPVGGVGLEAHLTLAYHPNPTSVAANMARFAALGLEVAITEMDVQIYQGSGTQAQRLQEQARYYGDIASACHHTPACKTFVIWGFTDKYSWIYDYWKHADAPLPFDASYAPKPAWQALLDTFLK